MGERYKPVKGDRVRVVLEGEVGWVSSSGTGNFEMGDGETYVNPERAEVVSIEKIEPPVTVFQPGDVVREKNSPYTTALISLGRDGFINHSDGSFYRYGQGGFYLTLDKFNSGRFEKVSLG